MNGDDRPALKTDRTFFQSIINLFNKKDYSKTSLHKYLQEVKNNNVINNEEATMIAGVLSVSEKRVRDVMLPKSQMVIVENNMTFTETIKLVLDSGHSRFPVEKDDSIIGILLAKDLLAYVNHPAKDFKVEKIMRPVRNIPESKPLNILLREFRHQRQHMVIVTNEYGDAAGLATIEDVLEEIVGEIDDEYDNESANDIKKINNNMYIVSALTEIEDFNDFFKTKLDKETNDTIGGFILSKFGYVPQKGEQMLLTELNFTIRNADDRRILDLLIEKQKKTS